MNKRDGQKLGRRLHREQCLVRGLVSLTDSLLDSGELGFAAGGAEALERYLAMLVPHSEDPAWISNARRVVERYRESLRPASSADPVAFDPNEADESTFDIS